MTCDVLSGGDLPHKSYLLPLSALVFMSQIIVYTIRLNVPLHMYIENKVTGILYEALKVLLVLCGIWSLDFFRYVIPPFCVNSHIKTVHALALEYLVAFYPICLTYICRKLHDNNFRPQLYMCDYGNHFTDTLFTSGGDGTPKHL